MSRRAIVWFRNDLRLTDNPSLSAAVASAQEVIPVYIHAPMTHGDWPQGSAARSWLVRSLVALDTDLRRRGSRLTLRVGDPDQVLPALAAETLATRVHIARRHGISLRRAEARVVAHLEASGLEVHTFETALLMRPEEIKRSQGEPYKMFTPFARALEKLGPPEASHPAPPYVPGPEWWPRSASPYAVLEPGDERDTDPPYDWHPGEAGALARMRHFVDDLVAGYAGTRDRPDLDGTSRLSTHLSFGEIGARQLWHAANEATTLAAVDDPKIAEGARELIRQLYWREFAYHLLVNFPHTPERPLRPEYDVFPWSRDPDGMLAWQEGRTGYPIVDAGMRQLAETGWMHNRVRMLVASFLTKDLLLPWLTGARFFWDRLADADLANNTLGWQWVAGCGADSVPFFRIFNPVVQGERYDPDGSYVRKWVPELAMMPAEWIHRPWEAPGDVLSAAGVRLGQSYPHPIIDHVEARKRALAVHASLRRTPA